MPLGWLAFKEKSDVFVLPPRFRGMETEIQQHTGEVNWEEHPEFTKWLGDRSDDSWALPNVRYNAEREYGWYTNHFDVICRLYLQIRPGADGLPEAFIIKGDADEIIPNWNIDFSLEEEIDLNMDVVGHLLKQPRFSSTQLVNHFPYQPQLVATDDTMVEFGLPHGYFEFKNGMSDIEIVFHDYLDEQDDDEGSREENSRIFGPEVPLWAQVVVSALSGMQDTERDSILFNRGQIYKFYPVFKLDESLPTAAPAGSLAAALIANAHAPIEDRLVTQLRMQTEKIARAGLTYVDGLRTFHQEAIDKM